MTPLRLQPRTKAAYIDNSGFYANLDRYYEKVIEIYELGDRNRLTALGLFITSLNNRRRYGVIGTC